MQGTLNAPRLMVLDDDAAVAAVIARVGESVGFETLVCTSADDFFQRLDGWQPSHIVLDLMMPGTDGIEVIRRLAEQRCEARLYLLSGTHTRVLEAAQRYAGDCALDIAGTLSKPFRAEDLREVLHRPIAKAPPKRVRTHFKASAASLRGALDAGHIEVFYQPQIDCNTSEVTGFEALLRWQHPDAGIVMPDDFIPIAETSGLIHRLTDQMLGQSFRWLASTRSPPHCGLSINLSPISLAKPGFAENLSTLCSTFRIAASRLILEVTETAVIEQPTVSLATLMRLRIMGFEVSIDDFGSGRSSMHRLLGLPFSELKIDKLFTLSATQSSEARAVIIATVELGHRLGLQVIAEGVEDSETLHYLQSLHCNRVQGFLFSEAIPGDDVARWADQYRLRTSTGTAGAADRGH